MTKETKQQAREELGLVSAYDQVVAKMNAAGKTVQNLTAKKAQGIKLSDREQKELDESVRAFKKYQSAALKADRSIGRFQRNVGNYPKALRSAASAARSLASALGLVGGAFLVVNTIRNAISVIKDFDKANASLSGILQVERKEMKALTDDAKRLGAVTVKTANEVTQLQIAYARLGFTQSEIVDLTESTIEGSIAMNAELDKTANLVGAVVNTFDDFSSTDAPEIIDILALSTAKSALNFEKLEKGIPIVAGAANAAGIPFTKLVALLGKLSDSGIDVSSSSTALRNIFIESAKQGLNYSQILEKLKNSQDKLTAANDEFGKRAAVSATVLSSNIEATNELDEALQNAAGTAEDMANKELDTLDGALQLLKSAWQGVILETDEANSISSRLKDTVQFLAKNLNQILATLFKVGKAFLIWKGILLATSLITRVYTGLIVGLRIAKIALAGGIGKATIAMKAFNIATKANPIGILISVLAGAIAVFAAFKDGVNESADAFLRLKDNADKATDAIVKNSIAQIDEQLRQIDAEEDNQKEANKKKIDLLDENINDQKEGTADLYDDLNEITEKGEEKINKTLDEKLAERAKAQEDYLKNLEKFQKGEIDQLPTQAGIVELTSEEKKILEQRGSIRTDAEKQVIKKLLELRKKFSNSLNKIEKEDDKKSAKQSSKDLFELEKTKLKIAIENAKSIIENQEKSLDDRQRANALFVDKSMELAELETEFAIKNAKKRSNLIKKINLESDQKKTEIEKQGVENRDKIFESELKKSIDRTKKLAESQGLALQKELTELKENLTKQGLSREEIDKKVTARREEILKDQLKTQIEFAIKELEAVEATEEQKVEIYKAVAKLREQLADLSLPKEDDEAERIRELRIETEAFIKAISTDFLSDSGFGSLSLFVKDQFNEITGEWESTFDKLLDGADTLGEKFAVTFSAISMVAQDVFNTISQASQARFEQEISQLDQEAEIALQFAGDNAAAKEAIEEQLSKRKKEIQIKQAKSEKANALFGIALNTARGITAALTSVPVPNVPLSIAIGVIGLTQAAAVQSRQIPQFEKGTMNAPKTSMAMVDEKGAEIHTDSRGKIKSLGENKGPRLTKVSKGDKIYTAQQSRKMKDNIARLTDIGNVMFDTSLLSLPKSYTDAIQTPAFNDERILDRLKSLEQTIKNRPYSTTNIDKNGVHTYVHRGQTKINQLNNQVTFRSQDV